METAGGVKKALSVVSLHWTSGSEFPTGPSSQRIYRAFYMNLI